MAKETGPVDTIYQYIKDQIDARAVFPGYRIIEEDLARVLNLSRTSVRTGLAKLQNDGLVDIFPNRGTYIAKPTRQDILDVYSVRFSLEVAALRLALPKITDEAVGRMAENLESQKQLKERFSITEYAALNRAFHWEIVTAAGNPFIHKYLNELYNKVHIYLIFFDTSVDNANSLQSHTALLEAVRRRDLDAGVAAIERDNQRGILDIRSSY